MKPKIIIESPFRAETQAGALLNQSYLNRAIHDSIMRGEVPFASHKMYPGALDDNIPEERKIGMKLGYEWWDVVDKIVFYIDLGWSEGMHKARQRAYTEHRTIEIRKLGPAE